jgi:Asp-tRNA(Asn)/Glu-tRNA(Gln) amidotransferase A subunit family amidase
MVPVALGTQVSGSLIRPASYCANVALRPSLGGILRGERSHYSHGVIGVHAGSLVDMWHTAIEIAKRAGGDPGYPGLQGDDEFARPVQPRCLGVLETEGWATVDDLTRSALDMVLGQLGKQATRVVRRREDPFLDALDRAIGSATSLNADILAWENRWVYAQLVETTPERLSAWTMRLVERGREMSVDDYRVALARREDARRALARLAGRVDALITLASPGSAPPFERPADGGDPRVPYGTTGRSTFNIGTSLLGVPAVTLPLTAVRGMPVGIQVIGQPGQDEQVCAFAHWIMKHVERVAI